MIVSIEIKGFPLIENGVIVSRDTSKDIFLDYNYLIQSRTLNSSKLFPQKIREFIKLGYKKFNQSKRFFPETSTICNFYNIVVILSYDD